ncbi:MAG TPA: hypothetical protein VGZ22_26685 [Isosphaeraceae bacterium]|jgi:hypothetical protein|nr:hypothetical protein [Isosphaeraceae bacterium]
MPNLTEFLREQAERLRSDSSGIESERTKWVESVDRLLRQMIDWLEEADPNRVLSKTISTMNRVEERLGAYEVKWLSIYLGDRQVRVVPVASDVIPAIGSRGDLDIRARGRVDMLDTIGFRKYMLYRGVEGQEEQWTMIDDRTYEMQNLTRATFEAAVQSLLE